MLTPAVPQFLNDDVGQLPVAREATVEPLPRTKKPAAPRVIVRTTNYSFGRNRHTNTYIHFSIDPSPEFPLGAPYSLTVRSCCSDITLHCQSLTIHQNTRRRKLINPFHTMFLHNQDNDSSSMKSFPNRSPTMSMSSNSSTSSSSFTERRARTIDTMPYAMDMQVSNKGRRFAKSKRRVITSDRHPTCA